MSVVQKLLVTGGAGFIGSNFIHYTLKTKPNITITNLDKLTYAGNLRNLEGIFERYPGRHRFVKGDICDSDLVLKLVAECDAIVHLAAESHVDRSINSPGTFIETNISGTLQLLEAVLRVGGRRFIHVSTDEVYGTLTTIGAAFTETSPLLPNSPYSASKACSDLLVRSFVQTHAIDAVIVRCSNNYGPYQFPEKLIPLIITNAYEDQPLPIYGSGKNIRDWLYVTDHCEGILRVLEKGGTGEIYNLGGRSERQNIEVVKMILKTLKKKESLIRFVKDRKGHDWRYSLNCSKAEQELGWKPTVSFEEGLTQTIQWYLQNESWWREVKSGAYQDFYKRYYGELV